jgi:hypothetical protein
VHDQLRPSDEENEQAPERIPEEDAKTGAGFDDPELPGDAPPDEEIHES